MKNGPAAFPVYIGSPLPLERDMIATLTRGDRSKASIARIRDSHHNIARLTALGLRPKAIAERMGMSRQRVAQLLQAPAMKELIERYRARIDEKFDESADAFFEVATSNLLAAQRHISDRFAELDDAGELMPVREALAVAADAADRVGYSKKQTNVNVNLDFAARLEAAGKRSAKIVELKPTALAEPQTLKAIEPPVRLADSSQALSPPASVEAPLGPSIRRRA